MKSEIKLLAVHQTVKSKFKANYNEIIEPYKTIIKQVMDANNIDHFTALSKINNSSIVQAKTTGNKKKDKAEILKAHQKQQLFVSAAWHMRYQD